MAKVRGRPTGGRQTGLVTRSFATQGSIEWQQQSTGLCRSVWPTRGLVPVSFVSPILPTYTALSGRRAAMTDTTSLNSSRGSSGAFGRLSVGDCISVGEVPESPQRGRPLESWPGGARAHRPRRGRTDRGVSRQGRAISGKAAAGAEKASRTFVGGLGRPFRESLARGIGEPSVPKGRAAAGPLSGP